MPTKRRARTGTSPPGRTGTKPARSGGARPKRNEPTPGRRTLPIVKVELPSWSEGDPGLARQDGALTELLGNAWPNYARAVAEGCRLKRRVVQLLPKPRKPKTAAPPPIGLNIPQTERTKPPVGYTTEPGAVVQMLRTDHHREADRWRSVARRQEAHAAVDTLYNHDASMAKDRVHHLIDEMIEMAKTTVGIRGLTRTKSLVSDLERLRTFLMGTDRPDLDIADANDPINSQDVIDDLRRRLRELRDDRRCSFYDLDKAAEQQKDLVGEPAWFKHSEDFTSVRWGTETFTFTVRQAEAVEALWDAWRNGTPSLQQHTIGEKIDSRASRFRLCDVFWRSRQKEYHEAWKTMITSSGRGTFQISEPANK